MNDKYHEDNKEGLNMFTIKQDLNQLEKDYLFNLILHLDKKLALARKTKNNKNLKLLICLRKRAVDFLKEFREEYVKTG